jgi:hypothetical protein
VALRILAIDDEIAALDGAADRTVLWSGVGLALLGVFGFAFAVLGTDHSTFGFFLITTTIAAAPMAILGLHLSSNRARRRRLERELDSLIDQGSPS